MSVLAVFSQPLRQSQAVSYLAGRPENERKVLVTREPAVVDTTRLPQGTEVIGWGQRAPSRPAADISDRLVSRAKSWVKGGSPMGNRLGRWLRGAAWRLRYVDRLASLIQAGRAKTLFEMNGHLLAVLREVHATEHIDDIAVFDLFDLPVVLGFSEEAGCSVRVL